MNWRLFLSTGLTSLGFIFVLMSLAADCDCSPLVDIYGKVQDRSIKVINYLREDLEVVLRDTKGQKDTEERLPLSQGDSIQFELVYTKENVNLSIRETFKLDSITIIHKGESEKRQVPFPIIEFQNKKKESKFIYYSSFLETSEIPYNSKEFQVLGKTKEKVSYLKVIK